jgi:hypothetical protein
LYCLSFDWRLLNTSLVSFGHCIVCSSIDGFWLPLRYLLVIVLSVLRLTASKQKPSIEEQTIQWPKDTKEVIRSRQSKNRQYNGQKIPKRYSEAVNPLHCLSFDWRLRITSLVSFSHCIVCSSIDGFWLPLWYLLAIVSSVLLRFMPSDYPFGIFWPLYLLSYFN